jgi:hypothetical protein
MGFDTRASGSPPPSTELGPLPVGCATRLVVGDETSIGTAAAEPGRPQPATTADGAPPARAPRAGDTRSLRWLPRQLTSGVGRRLLAMFVLTALTPVALMAGLSFTQFFDAVRVEHDRDLVQSARAHGAAVVDRLRWAESLVAVAATSASPAASLAARLGREFSGYSIVDRKGRTIAQGGKPPPTAVVAGAAVSAARPGRRTTLLTWNAGHAEAQGLVSVFDAAEAVGVVAVTLSPEFLWTPRAADPKGSSFCVLTTRGTPLHCPAAMPEEAVQRLVAPAADGERLARFVAEGGTMRAGAVVIDAGVHFGGPEIVVAASGREESLLNPTAALRGTFLPAAGLSVLLVLLLSVVEVRRIMTPLHAVLDGMRRCRWPTATSSGRWPSRSTR